MGYRTNNKSLIMGTIIVGVILAASSSYLMRYISKQNEEIHKNNKKILSLLPTKKIVTPKNLNVDKFSNYFVQEFGAEKNITYYDVMAELVKRNKGNLYVKTDSTNSPLLTSEGKLQYALKNNNKFFAIDWNEDGKYAVFDLMPLNTSQAEFSPLEQVTNDLLDVSNF